jgi:hypothetical protein
MKKEQRKASLPTNLPVIQQRRVTPVLFSSSVSLKVEDEDDRSRQKYSLLPKVDSIKVANEEKRKQVWSYVKQSPLIKHPKIKLLRE